jgi:hypothetical protein
MVYALIPSNGTTLEEMAEEEVEEAPGRGKQRMNS